MKEAFYYMFKDNMFKNKVLMYFVSVLLANFLIQYGNTFAPVDKNVAAPMQYHILNLLGFIALFIPCGYGVMCLRALMEQKENFVLPFLNIKNSFVLGFKLMSGIILLSIAFGLFYLILAIIFGVLAFILKMPTIMSVLYMTVLLLFVLLIVIFTPAFSCILAKKEWYTTFFRFIKSAKLIKNDVGNYFKGVGLFIAISILVAIINAPLTFLLWKNVYGAFLSALIGSLISSYTVFVYAYIFAKTVKHECIE